MKNKIILLTGLPCSGKTTIANALNKHIENSIVIDGDEIRKGLNSDLGYSIIDRDENIRRVVEIIKILNKLDVVIILSFIFPYKKHRDMIKNIIDTEVIEVYVNTCLSECEKRDIKEMYKKARNNEINNFTGVSDVYQIPEQPNIIVSTENKSIDECINLILNEVRKNELANNL